MAAKEYSCVKRTKLAFETSLAQLAKEYPLNKVTVKMLIGNDASEKVYKDMDDQRSFSFTSLNGRFGGCYHKKAHTGEQFFFPGITFTILYTHEDYYPKVLDEYNNLSVVFDGVVNGEVLQKSVKDGQTRFVWLGDAQTLVANKLCSMYGADLKCDVMQVAHHSHSNGGSLKLYQYCNPSVAFCPGITVEDDPYANASHNKYLTSTVDKYYRQDTGNHTISFETLLNS